MPDRKHFCHCSQVAPKRFSHPRKWELERRAPHVARVLVYIYPKMDVGSLSIDARGERGRPFLELMFCADTCQFVRGHFLDLRR